MTDHTIDFNAHSDLVGPSEAQQIQLKKAMRNHLIRQVWVDGNAIIHKTEINHHEHPSEA